MIISISLACLMHGRFRGLLCVFFCLVGWVCLGFFFVSGCVLLCLFCHNSVGEVKRVWAMLVCKGGATYMGTLAWVTMHVDVRVTGHTRSFLSYPCSCNSSFSPMGQGLKLAVLTGQVELCQMRTSSPMASPAGSQTCW